MQLSALTSFYEWHSLKKNSISKFDQHSDLFVAGKKNGQASCEFQSQHLEILVLQ